MNKQLYFLLLYIGAFLFILGASEMVYKRLKVDPEYTRKISHIIVTLTSLSFVYAFQSQWYVLGLAVFSFLLLFAGKLTNAFKSIENVRRQTLGSIFLPAGIYFSFAFAEFRKDKLLFVLPVLILSISDALAGLIGMRFQNGESKIAVFGRKLDKSFAGTFTFLVSSAIVCYATFMAVGFELLQVFVLTLSVSLITTLTELLSPNGTDNFTIPVVASLLLAFLL